MRFITGFLVLLIAWNAAAGLPAAGAQGEPKPGGSESGPAASPTPKATPASIAFREKVVFTLALGKDATINTDIAVALAKKLRFNDLGKVRTNAAKFVPEGTWGLEEFLEQCKTDVNHTLGAVIVLPSTYEAKNDNYLVMIRSTTTVEFNTMVATCTNADSQTPGVDWVADTSSGVYGRSVIQFLPLAVLTSVYLAFAPQRLFQTVATRVFPTPNPLPAFGAQTSVATTSQTTLNPSGTASLQGSVVNAVGIAALQFGRQGPTEHFTVHAADDAARDFLRQVKIRCPNWGATPLPVPATASATATDPASVATPSPPPPCGW
jgi:hypothetical protein